MQGGVERSFGQIEGPTTPGSQNLHDGVAVHGAPAYRGEKEHVEVTFKCFSGHSSQCYTSLCDVSSGNGPTNIRLQPTTAGGSLAVAAEAARLARQEEPISRERAAACFRFFGSHRHPVGKQGG